MGGTTSKGWPYPIAGDGPDGANVVYWIGQVVAFANSNAALYDSGTIGSRPAAGKAGRFYRSTNETPNVIYLDTGSDWLNVSAMGDDSVLTAMLADGAVTAPKLATDAVYTAAIQALAVTGAKLAAGAVTAAKVADALKPSAGAGGSTEALRALGSAAGTACAGDDARLPTAGEKAALAGTSGTPGSGNKYVTQNDTILGQQIPAGTVLPYAGTAAPTGFVLANGGVYDGNQPTYLALWAVIGNTYGGADQAHMTVPDLRQKFPLGKAASGTGAALGATGGTIDHVHTGPSHTHSTPNHAHAGTTGGPSSSASAQTPGGFTFGVAAHTHDYTTPSGGGGTSGSGGTGNTGTNNPPYLALNYIIKL